MLYDACDGQLDFMSDSTFRPRSRGRIWLRALVLALPLLSGCRPCGCDDAQMDAAMLAIASAAFQKEVVKGHITFAWSPNPFSDDGFSLEVTYQDPGPPPTQKTEKVTGTYHKSGDKVTFKVVGSKIIQPNFEYTILCKDKKLTLTRAGTPDLTFDCSS
jgi:hypothetical protein